MESNLTIEIEGFGTISGFVPSETGLYAVCPAAASVNALEVCEGIGAALGLGTCKVSIDDITRPSEVAAQIGEAILAGFRGMVIACISFATSTDFGFGSEQRKDAILVKAEEALVNLPCPAFMALPYGFTNAAIRAGMPAIRSVSGIETVDITESTLDAWVASLELELAMGNEEGGDHVRQ